MAQVKKSGAKDSGVGTLGIVFVLLLLPVLAYHAALQNGFVIYDDPYYVYENSHVLQGLTLENVGKAFGALDQGNWHPLTWLSHMAVVEVAGLNPLWHHLVNLVLHCCNVLLLFLLLQSMTGARWRSAAVAALFAVHPLHVESVVWISERKDVLSMLFALLSVHAYGRYAKEGGVRWYITSLCCMFLGMMSKPMLVTLPVLLLLVDYWPLGRLAPFGSEGFLQRNKMVVLDKVPYVLAAIIFSIVAVLAQEGTGALAPLSEWSVWQRLGTVLGGYLAYLGKFLLPVHLAVFYPLEKNIPIWETAVAGAVLFAITAACIKWGKRLPWLFTGWFWYLIAMLPVIGIVQIGMQSMADRYTYLPMLGLYILLVWGGASLLERSRLKKTGSIAAVLLVVILGAAVWQTNRQVRVWRNSITLFEHAAAVTDKNFVAYDNLGKAYLQQGDLQNALYWYDKRLMTRPQDGNSYWNVADIQQRSGKLEAALQTISKGLEQKSGKASLLKLRGLVEYRMGDLDAARQSFIQAVELAPDDQEARKNLAIIERESGTAGNAPESKEGVE